MDPTLYCSKNCLQTDRPNHKSYCQARQKLFRGAGLLQEVFYAYRELAFDLDFANVDAVNGKLHVRDAVYPKDRSTGPLFTFPGDLIPDPKLKAALLTLNACSDPLQYMHGLTSKILLSKFLQYRSLPLYNPADIVQVLPANSPSKNSI